MDRLAADLSASEARLDRILKLAHRDLQTDVVYVSEFRDGQQLYRSVAGDGASFNIAVSDGLPAVATYDRRMVEGEIPNVICDTAADERVAELPVTRFARIGAYIGVPVRLADGTLYGTLSGACHDANHRLDERAKRLLSLLGNLLVYELEDQRSWEKLREQIVTMIDGGGFDVAYQPIFNLGSDRCIGLEALARFPSPFGKPDETFAAAEQIGLGVELERAVIRRAVSILPRLAPGQFLALNSSPAALLELARRAAHASELPWSRLVVEVTEHSAVDAYLVLQDELAPLRRRGLRIAVDDAGAGYASLRHVLELRPDFIKLDRWLVDGVAQDEGRRAAVSAFVSLARQLGSTVVGEGVEMPADLLALRELGLDAAQGYLLGRPTSDQAVVAEWCSAISPMERPPAVMAITDATPGEETDRKMFERERERERLELERRVSHRLEAVGQLSAGIAHEINTPLQFVGDSVTFLRDAVDELLGLTALYRETLHSTAPIPVEERRRTMHEAEERAEVDYLCERIPLAFARTTDGIARVRSIVQAMKRFSHASISSVEPADLNEAIETTLAVCRNEYKYVAEVVTDLRELPAITCNIGELNQVFLNLIINAAQALEEKVGDSGERGLISIRTRVDGPEAVIEIADDGPGIPPELQDRIYEPFFTTKEVGRGTGQGLALARNTIQRHNGSLNCVSEPGRGAIFTIRLPLERSADAIPAAA